MLISCAAYQDGTKLGDIPIEQIQEYLHKPHCFVWVALHDPDEAELAGMQRAFDLHPLAVEDALVGHQRPKILDAVERRIFAPEGVARDNIEALYAFKQRLNQTADSIRDTVATAISVNLSMITLQENATMKRLAAYAALLAVPTMIAGIYGMNFDNMPELKWHYGYALSLVVMAAIDVYLYMRFKTAQWL